MTEGTGTQFTDDLQYGQKKSLGQKIKDVFSGHRNDAAMHHEPHGTFHSKPL